MLATEATLWPMIAHAALVLILHLLQLRRPASAPLQAAIRSQFELPVLFHAVCLTLYASTADNLLTVALSWIFVASRYGHAWLQVAESEARRRDLAFLAGAAALLLLWLWLAFWLALN